MNARKSGAYFYGTSAYKLHAYNIDRHINADIRNAYVIKACITVTDNMSMHSVFD